MKTLQTFLFAITVVAATTLSGCSSLEQFNERGQALRAADPVAYDKITGEGEYFSQNPQFNVHGS